MEQTFKIDYKSFKINDFYQRRFAFFVGSLVQYLRCCISDPGTIPFFFRVLSSGEGSFSNIEKNLYISGVKTRKEDIIKASIRRFNRHGFGKTTLDEIARDLRIGKATIYYYFDSKETLFRAAIQAQVEEYHQLIRAIADDSTERKEKIKKYLEVKAELHRTHPMLVQLVINAYRKVIQDEETTLLAMLIQGEAAILHQMLELPEEKQDSRPLAVALHTFSLPLTAGVIEEFLPQEASGLLKQSLDGFYRLTDKK